MVKRKIFLFFLMVSFVLVFCSLIVSAYYSYKGDVSYYLDKAVYQAEPVIKFFLGGSEGYSSYMFFERILVFFIIMGICFVSLKRMPFFKDQKNVVIVLSLAVSLLAVRFIDLEWLNTIITTYKVFGITLTSILPFVIYFFFLLGIAENYPGIRKIGWILFGCVYLGLYTTTEDSFYGQVHLWTAFVAFAFFFLDGTIQNYITKQKIKYGRDKHFLKRAIELEKEIKDFIDLKGADPSGWTSNEKRYYESKKKELDEIYKLVNR